MKWTAFGSVGLLCASALNAGDGTYGGAIPRDIDFAVEDGPESAREGAWLIQLGDGDWVDSYRLEPPPFEGDQVAFFATTDGGEKVPVTAQLVTRFGQQVVSEVSLMDDSSFDAWVVDEPVFLRVELNQGHPRQEVLVGVRIFRPE